MEEEREIFAPEETGEIKETEATDLNTVAEVKDSNVAIKINDVIEETCAPSEKEETALADRVKVISPFKLVVKRFFRSKLSVVGLSIFLFLLLFSYLGPVFVPWTETEQDVSVTTYSKNILPHEYATGDEADDGKYWYYTITTSEINFNAHAKAGTYGVTEKGVRAMHLLGTDDGARDVFVRLMYGGRLSLTLAFFVVLIYTVIGVVLGGLAGYFGKWVDMVIMRIVDILNCIPSLPVLLIIGVIVDGFIFNGTISQNSRIYIMMGVLTLMSWPGTARLVRGQILFLREQEYMVATEALGFSSARKIFHHLVPNVMPQLIVTMTLGLGGTILTEASLSFLGLGVPSTLASLGQMVSLATKNLDIMNYYILTWLPAGILIILAVVAFNFIGDGLRDALDPKMKR